MIGDLLCAIIPTIGIVMALIVFIVPAIKHSKKQPDRDWDYFDDSEDNSSTATIITIDQNNRHN